MDQENKIPRHVAIIMDGNGRWAKERNLPRTAGHLEGTKRVKEIVKAAGELGIKFLTLYAFSAENWNRPQAEISVLMHYLESFLERELPEMQKNNIRFRVIGRGSPVPESLQQKLKSAEEATAKNTGLTLVLAINYGSRQEMADALKGFGRALQSGQEDLEKVDELTLGRYLYTQGIPDPDLLIRTAGQMRISNFLLWQISYAELYFPQKYWPDFNRGELVLAIEEFNRRERRFGGL